jgi:hypothetical protein
MDDDAMDTMSMDDDAMDTMSMDDDAMDTMSMDSNGDAMETWSPVKSNNALDTMSTRTTGDDYTLNPPDVEPTVTNDALNTRSSGGPTGTNDVLTPLIPGPTGTTGDDYTLNPPDVEPSRTNDTLTPSSSGFRIEGNAEFVENMLAIHNRERALVGSPPLTYNNSLAAKAQTWADHLATTGVLAHSTCCGVFRDYGETAAWNPGAEGNATAMAIGAADAWRSEVSHYHGGPFDLAPQNSYETMYGHYTQMVWKGTTQIGCGYAGAYTVCQYLPPGNIVGQLPY